MSVSQSTRQNDDCTKMNAEIQRAVEVIRSGGIILYPTDTIWGIGCDATNKEAVSRIFDIKRRDDSKALITLIPQDSWLERYVTDVPEVAWELIDVAVDPLTIVYDKGRNVAENLLAPDGSIGIRITGDPFCRSLCLKSKVPLVSTSANISGQPSPLCFGMISKDIIEAVDYVVDWRRNDNSQAVPSGVIKLSKGGLFKILR